MRKRSLLHNLAQASGIQTSYLDNQGNGREASAETLVALLQVLGVEAGDEKTIRGQLDRLVEARRTRLSEPVIVCWEKRQNTVSVPQTSNQLGRAELTLESGERIDLQRTAGNSRSAFRGKHGSSTFLLPELPAGYHTLHLDSGGKTSESLVIAAPQKIYSPGKDLRQWGIFLPLYAAHSEESWGSGNFSDWKKLGEWLAAQNGQVMSSLPILSAFLDHPVVEPSPYSPASRLFWNEFFIDITAIPEFQNSARAKAMVSKAAFKTKLSRFRKSELVDYPAEWAVRRRILEVLANEFFLANSPRRKKFQAYVSERPIVREYAEFRAVCDKQKTAWRAWETGKKKSAAGKDYDPECRDFYLYIQWVAQEQINDLISNFNQNGLRFYLDLPLGVNPDSFDAFFYRDYFADGASAGAPPDSFFTKGQDWGFAPLHPEKIREHHYRYLIDYLDFQMRHTGMLRIDHVMGLHRLYWVPHGFPASSGAYVRYRSEELYAILSVESHRHKAMLVGENLGTVPPEVNQSMARHGLRRMYVLQYEQQPSGSLRPPDHPVAASMNSHDMPTFAAHWEGEDITDRASLGLLTKAQVREETKNRARLRKNLVQFLRSEKLLKTARPSVEEIYSAAIQFLSSSPAETVLVNLEDLWCEKKPQNTPGTSTQRVNWRRKSALTIEQIGSLSTQDAAVRDLLEQLASRLSKG